MNGNVAVLAVVDVSRVERALDLALKSAGRRLDNVLRSTAFWTAVWAQQETPFAELGTIDAKMSEIATSRPEGRYGQGKGGKALMRFGAQTMTVAEAIVLSRMYPGSRYSQLTDNRWPVTRPNLSAGAFNRAYGDPGMARQVFWNFVEEVAERMVKARHSSTHFLQTGWGAVAKKMRAAGFRANAALGGPVIDIEAVEVGAGNTLPSGAALGDFSEGRAGDGIYKKIENLVGMDEKYPTLSAERQRALFEIGGPALERAAAQQAVSMRDHYLPKVGEEMRLEWEAV